MRDGRFVSTSWSNIRVGDILKISRNETVPADCVFFSSTTESSGTPEIVYVQTAQLDGETSLKMKQAIPPTVNFFTDDEQCANFRGRLIAEAPNASFDKFTGKLYMKDGQESPESLANCGGVGSHAVEVPALGAVGTQEEYILEVDQLLLRGSVVRNVDFVYAMVVYTGKETKVRVRATARPLKRAQVEAILNKFILLLLFLLVVLCLIGTSGTHMWYNQYGNRHWYLVGPGGEGNDYTSGRAGVATFFTYFLLNSSLIPVSLYVSVRLARSFQMLMMERDYEMTHVVPELYFPSKGEEGLYPFKVRSMDLNDELGQITHIFSDKTGTLTLNYMEFRKVLVGSISYGLGTTDIGLDRLKREGHDIKTVLEEHERVRAASIAAQSSMDLCIPFITGRDTPHVNFEDGSESHPGRTLAADIVNSRDEGQGQAIHEMLLNFALNHSVVREAIRDANGNLTGTRLSASSPDEEAFLYASETFGYSFAAKTPGVMLLSLRNKPESYPFLQAKKSFSEEVLNASRDMTPVPIVVGESKNSSRTNSEATVNVGDAHHAPDKPGKPPRAPVRAVPKAAAASASHHVPFRVLHVLAYTQERKRMSVLVEHPVLDVDGTPVIASAGQKGAMPAANGMRGEIWLYTKGADSALFPRLRTPTTVAESEKSVTTSKVLADWGNDGLRTLVFAARKVSFEEYEEWNKDYSAALLDMEEVRRKRDKMSNRIDELQEIIERDLVLQGASANEDKLQPGVPDTIAQLAKAGIKTWMVTGDKQETAVNIGFATRLLDDTQRQVVATVESAGSIKDAIKRIRIAAKRMREDRRREREELSQSLTRDSVVGWATRQVALMENNFKQMVNIMVKNNPEDKPTEIDIDAMTKKAMKNYDGSDAPTLQVDGFGGKFRKSIASIRNLPTWARGSRASMSLRTRTGSFVGEGAHSTEEAYGFDPDSNNNTQVDSTSSPTKNEIESRTRASTHYESESDEEEVIVTGSELMLEIATGHRDASEAQGSSSSNDMPTIGSSVSIADPSLHDQTSQSLYDDIGSSDIYNLSSEDPSGVRHRRGGRGAGPDAHPSLPASYQDVTDVDSSDKDTTKASFQVAALPGAAFRRPCALIIDEETLDAALLDPKSRAYLLYVAVNAAAVVACRARPDQKAAVVRLIRQGVPKARTLAVGDGANDVDMIGEAHVGVGIAGAEGVQAANASDYSVGRFRFLQRLLLVHGRWNYLRMARLVLYMFFKNIALVVTQFIFQFYTAFSGQKWYMEAAAQLYNLVFTGLPVLLMAIGDRDIHASTVLRYPKLYDHGRLARGLNIPIFIAYVLDGLLSAVVISMCVIYGYSTPDINDKYVGGYGATPHIFQMGLVAFTAVVVTVSIRVASEMNFHHWIFGFALFLSAGSWLPFTFGGQYLPNSLSDYLEGGILDVWASADAWLVMILISGFLGSRLVGWKAAKRFYAPQLRHIVHEAEYINSFRHIEYEEFPETGPLSVNSDQRYEEMARRALQEEKFEEEHPVFASLDKYTEAADLARRSGRSIQDVYEVEKLATAAASALVPMAVKLGMYEFSVRSENRDDSHSPKGQPGFPPTRPAPRPGDGQPGAHDDSAEDPTIANSSVTETGSARQSISSLSSILSPTLDRNDPTSASAMGVHVNLTPFSGANMPHFPVHSPHAPAEYTSITFPTLTSPLTHVDTSHVDPEKLNRAIRKTTRRFMEEGMIPKRHTRFAAVFAQGAPSYSEFDDEFLDPARRPSHIQSLSHPSTRNMYPYARSAQLAEKLRIPTRQTELDAVLGNVAIEGAEKIPTMASAPALAPKSKPSSPAPPVPGSSRVPLSPPQSGAAASTHSPATRAQVAASSSSSGGTARPRLGSITAAASSSASTPFSRHNLNVPVAAAHPQTSTSGTTPPAVPPPPTRKAPAPQK